MKDLPIEVLAADGKHEVLEGDPIEGMVIVKFPSVKVAKDWIDSEAYQNVAKHRKLGGSITDSLLKVSANGDEIDAQ